jgi:PAS domain S-box-containing protein
MLALLNEFFTSPFIPHGHCYLWKPELVWLHVASDSLIALSYYSIPLTLVYFVRKRRDLPFDWIFLLFSAFIIACGTTHLMAVWTLWYPTYWVSGFVKLVTAGISAYTAIQLVSLIPQALALPSPAQLEEKNHQLAKEIRDRITAESQLQLAHQQLQFHIENSPLAVVEWNDQFQIQRWSPRAERIFGWQAGETLGRHPFDWSFVFADDIDGVTCAINRLLDGSEGRSVYHNRNYTKAGEVLHCEWYNSVLRDESGQLISILSLALDVTEREQAAAAIERINLELEERVERRTAELQQTNEKLLTEIRERQQAEQALERERQQLRQIITNAPMAIAVFDPQMRYVAHSQTWLTMQGLTEKSLLDRHHYEIFPDIPDRWKQIHQRALAGEVLSSPEDAWERADGSVAYVRWAVHPWFTPEGTIGGIIIASDRINELVEAREAALEATKVKSQFLANMSHEIRTPINGVLGMAGLLLQTPLTSQQLDYGRAIRSSAEHLLVVINDILDFSKLEAGEMQLQHLDFDLDCCLESVVDILAAPAEEKGLELTVLVEGDVPRQLQGDAGRLRQVLLNLAGNAIKFTEAGEVAITASVSDTGASAPEPAVTLRFEVTDTGIGIAPDDQVKLFRSFSQVDASSTRQHGGTGLGLVICKQLVELMGGAIGVESTPGQGSTFWFTAVFDRQTTATVPTIPEALAQLKLLVVEDNTRVRQGVRQRVGAWGMQVDEASDRASALQALQGSATRGNAYDIVLLDLQLPDRQGSLLVSAIRSDSRLAQTKLILMTTLQHQEEARRFQEDVSGYVLKPIRTSRLFNRLLEAIAPDSLLEEENPSPSPDNSDRSVRHTLKILLVEDHPVNQTVTLSQLQVLGYAADCVSNGQEALTQLQQQDYDIVLMDCQMPVLDGYEATQALRRREGERRHTIVIALTAHALPAEREKCLAVGMDDYLSKPIEPDALQGAIARWTTLATPPAATEVATEPSPALNETLLDGERLQRISRGRVSVQRKLLQMFVENARRGLEQIHLALQVEDFATVEQQAHRIKGASANVGVRSLPELAAQLEQQAREQVIEGAAERLEALECHLMQIEAFLSTWQGT